ncbi:MAG: uracil permease [Firmicutes bacterium GWF2_51_9]|nr:MAG: uracil permease [Firmicutes bacterium GWF2_51_9]OGS59581.1 MAG: uracil permease [Firmicutes bacterium GWE2_51_13]HAM62944.1 uracil permease [Erysipelotrichaceae bacterium]HBZ41425.1 uracil permease [Erysipelotrichaceae bacterium]
MEKNDLLYDVQEKPPVAKWFVLSFQHVFAMFGATVLVPILTGLPVSVALFGSGVGTLIYIVATKAKVPVYLGSSFAYITAVIIARDALGGDFSAAQTGLILVGLVYVAVALLVKLIGKGWVDRILPPIVIGPMIMIIGLGLASVAVSSAGFTTSGDWRVMLTAVVTFVVTAVVMSFGKGFFKIIPFIIGIAAGYVCGALLGIVDFSPIAKADWLAFPAFLFPFKVAGFGTYSFYFGSETWVIVPIALVTISEHIGDHTVLGKICGKNFLKDPGLDRTLIGDGIATAVSAFVGGPANTTYGENTGVVGLTRVASVWVTGGAAVLALVLSFVAKVSALISTIPWAVLGGMSILLYGFIASNGLRVMIDEKIDFSKHRNIIIAASMLVLGLGGAAFKFVGLATLSGTALAAIVGVTLNLLLPEDKE